MMQCPREEDPNAICNKGYACDGCPYNSDIPNQEKVKEIVNPARIEVELDCNNVTMCEEEEEWFIEKIRELSHQRSITILGIKVYR